MFNSDVPPAGDAPPAFDTFSPFDDDDEEGRSGSMLPLWVGGGAVLALVVAMGAMAIRPSTPDDAVPVDTLPIVVADPVITPFPDSVIEGEVGTAVIVGFRIATPAGPVPDTEIELEVESGLAVLNDRGGLSTAQGIVTSTLDLGTTPGETVVLAQADGAEPGRLLVRTLTGTPDQIDRVSGNGQQADIGELLPERIVVRLIDRQGLPVPNAEVLFEVTSGEGLVAPMRTRTDDEGQASARWRLGSLEGSQQLASRASATGIETSFTATGLIPETYDPRETAPEQQASSVRPVTFAIGASHACRVVGGVVSCRGDNTRGQTTGSGRDGVVAIAAGDSHTCALDASGTASCWGANDEGQIGDGTRNDRATPTPVRVDLRFSQLVAGLSHTCGLAGGGVPVCWGLNLSGQLGDGTRSNQTTPRVVGSGMIFVDITAGWSHTCGLTANGNAFCWGANGSGQLGDGGSFDQLTPALMLSSVQSLSAGTDHTCGVRNRQVVCWGGNSFGQVGDGTTQNSSLPVPVQGLPPGASRVVAGAVHSCALMGDGTVYCWGQNRHGQLGNGSNENETQAVPIASQLRFRELYAGGAQTCGIASDGNEYCWGLNVAGQLGDGTRTSRSVPTRVGG